MTKKSDKYATKLLIAIDEAFEGDGYDGYNSFAEEIAMLVRQRITDSVNHSMTGIVTGIRNDYADEIKTLKRENKEMATQLEFYKAIEKAVVDGQQEA